VLAVPAKLRTAIDRLTTIEAAVQADMAKARLERRIQRERSVPRYVQERGSHKRRTIPNDTET